MKPRKINAVLIAAVAAAVMVRNPLSSDGYDLHGKIETMRKGNLITILLSKKPAQFSIPAGATEGATIAVPSEFTDYIILDGEHKEIGSARIVTATYSRTLRGKIRVIAAFSLKRQRYRTQLRAGNPIVLRSVKEQISEKSFVTDEEKIVYRREVVSPVDGRIMVLVPGGKFVFGSNRGNRDEYPEQVLSLDDFYIDKYEVSNRDFKRFVDITYARPPISWRHGVYDEESAEMPVLVTFYEAQAYASWARKRLPSEQEWEKAARGEGRFSEDSETDTLIYPWGNAFDQDRVNSVEFWSGKVIGMNLKNGYTVKRKGYLPVWAFENSGASPYGTVNMSGNAKEWTDSWYRPYRGNSFASGKYGTQYKVVRGGAWYNNRRRVRVTSREPGGVPSLHADNLAGFRCVKDPSILDRE